jgi:hypothetical protein
VFHTGLQSRSDCAWAAALFHCTKCTCTAFLGHPQTRVGLVYTMLYLLHYASRWSLGGSCFFWKTVSLPTPRGEDPPWPEGRKTARPVSNSRRLLVKIDHDRSNGASHGVGPVKQATGDHFAGKQNTGDCSCTGQDSERRECSARGTLAA